MTSARHRAFIAPRLLGSLTAIAILPVYVALRGAPGPLEAVVFGWLITPILVVYFLSRTGRYEMAHVLSSLALTVLVTADHGFIDAPAAQRIALDDHPLLAATLAQPLSGERRAAYCHVRPGQARNFEDYVRNELGEQALVFASDSLIEAGWFGPGEAHPSLRSRVGDYVLLMQAATTIKDWMPGERRHNMIGVHGGASADEMLVPLVVIEP